MQHYKPIVIAILLTSLAGFTLLQTSNNFIIMLIGNVDGVQATNIEENKKVNIESLREHHRLNYNHASFIITGFNSPLPEEEEKRSDLFYYILGILILIISAFILRQRYKQYLDEKNKFNQ